GSKTTVAPSSSPLRSNGEGDHAKHGGGVGEREVMMAYSRANSQHCLEITGNLMLWPWMIA
ncbi:MAG: hypothetical protein LBV49_05945, partial [Azonexus sp.]|nr:hypothetical protein [Azonexus sp.]